MVSTANLAQIWRCQRDYCEFQRVIDFEFPGMSGGGGGGGGGLFGIIKQI